mgnify:CR=1 FL=1|jgi:hypothetical protein
METTRQTGLKRIGANVYLDKAKGEFFILIAERFRPKKVYEQTYTNKNGETQVTRRITMQVNGKVKFFDVRKFI